MRRFVLALLVICLCLPLWAQTGYAISGKLDLSDDEWNPVVYLSLIEAFDQLATISGHMVIDQAPLDSNGHFSFTGNYLPEGYHLYRVHICKKGDPLSTIIIGGKEHNHFHFAMAPGQQIEILPGEGVFGGASVEGSPVNTCLRQVDDVMFRSRSARVPAGMSLRFRDEEAAGALLDLMEKCEVNLGSLYAAFNVLQRFDQTNEAGRLVQALSGMEDESSYHAEVIALAELKLGPLDVPKESTPTVYMLLLLIPLAAFLGWWLMKSGTAASQGDSLAELSMQERRVLGLLTKGMSNKEISAELNIGISTVKTHVHKIYKKLNISSRKEVLQFSGEFDSGRSYSSSSN